MNQKEIFDNPAASQLEYQLMRTSRPGLFYHFLLLAFILSLSHIIVHDFFCHEELHQLISPIHHCFHNPTRATQDLVPSNLSESSRVLPEVIIIASSGFKPSIFHPPD